jgi:hypothetical protein
MENASLERRFWDKVDRRGPDDCWPWKAGRDKDGYGRFAAGRTTRAHRYSWEVHNGPIPVGFLALHRCDNPPCVNPAHLFVGSHQDNIRDCVEQGRQSRLSGVVKARAGVTNGRAKLTLAQVAAIRSAPANVSNSALGRQHGVSNVMVSKIRRGKAWAA